VCCSPGTTSGNQVKVVFFYSHEQHEGNGVAFLDRSFHWAKENNENFRDCETGAVAVQFKSIIRENCIDPFKGIVS
jgi:hypothetical protein